MTYGQKSEAFAEVRDSLVKGFNKISEHAPEKFSKILNLAQDELKKQGFDEDETEINSKTYHAYAKAIKVIAAKDSNKYLSWLMGDPYSKINKDFNLVSAVKNIISNDVQFIIYSNGTREHVETGMKAAGFTPDDLSKIKIYDVFDSDKPKPSKEAFEKFINDNNINPKTSVFFDDSLKNGQTAIELGLSYIQVVDEKKSTTANFATMPKDCDVSYSDNNDTPIIPKVDVSDMGDFLNHLVEKLPQRKSDKLSVKG